MAELTKEEKDRLYNFTCPGCRMRRNKRAARMISSGDWANGAQVMYCKACATEIGDSRPLPKVRAKDIAAVEERWKVDLEALVREHAERPKQG